MSGQYQRAVTPALDSGVAANASIGNGLGVTALRGKILNYSGGTRRPTLVGTGATASTPGSSLPSTNQSPAPLPLGSGTLGGTHYRSQNVGVSPRLASGPDIAIQGRSSSSALGVRPTEVASVGSWMSSMNTPAANLAPVHTSGSSFQLIPLSDEIPADGIIFNRLRHSPETLVVYRTPEERQKNLERLNLDRRGLDQCPLLDQEQRLRLLNFQNNSIRQISNLENLPNLIFLDLYNNQITSLDGPLSTVKGLRVLMAGKNRIKQITNVSSLRKLDVLDLHSNEIHVIEGLETLGDLRVLNLAGNQLTQVSGLHGLTSLTELNLRRNQISTVVGLDKLPALQRLFLSHNSISSFRDISCVFEIQFLIELSLDGNPIAEDDPSAYRAHVISKIPSLKHLDLKKITPSERPEPVPTEVSPVVLDEEEQRSSGNSSVVSPQPIVTHIENLEPPISKEVNIGKNNTQPDSAESIATLARTGRLSKSDNLVDVEITGPDERCLIISGNSWEWSQLPRRLMPGITEAIFVHSKRDVLLTKLIPSFLSTNLPALKCLRFVNCDITTLKHIESLSPVLNCSSVESICFTNCGVCSAGAALRGFLIASLPRLRFCNDKEVTSAERLTSEKQFHFLASLRKRTPNVVPSTSIGGGRYVPHSSQLTQSKTNGSVYSDKQFFIDEETDEHMVNYERFSRVFDSVVEDIFTAAITEELRKSSLR